MSKLGYYGEVFFYPVAVVVSMAAITWRGSVDRWTVVLGALVALSAAPQPAQAAPQIGSIIR